LKSFENLKVYSTVDRNSLRIANPVSDLPGVVRKYFFLKAILIFQTISIFLYTIQIKIRTSPHSGPESQYFEKFTPKKIINAPISGKKTVIEKNSMGIDREFDSRSILSRSTRVPSSFSTSRFFLPLDELLPANFYR
jgi:hypothetical protein